MASDGVNLVYKDDAGRMLLALHEQIAHARRAHANEHLDKVGTGNRKERHARFARNRAREESLAGSRRPDQQDALGDSSAEARETFRSRKN